MPKETREGMIRGVLRHSAATMLPVSDTASIRDAASAVSSAIRSKGSKLYQQLDAATGGGRFQRFQDSLANIDRAMREALGVDPDRYDTLLERQAEVEQAQMAALDAAQKAGVDPKLIDQANTAWKQHAALNYLSAALRQSVKGQRPEIAGTATGRERPKV